jgi:serine/threonine protein kinase
MELHLSRTWVLVEQLGEGGYGRVYKAKDEDGRKAAYEGDSQPPSGRYLTCRNRDGIPR